MPCVKLLYKNTTRSSAKSWSLRRKKRLAVGAVVLVGIASIIAIILTQPVKFPACVPSEDGALDCTERAEALMEEVRCSFFFLFSFLFFSTFFAIVHLFYCVPDTVTVDHPMFPSSLEAPMLQATGAGACARIDHS